MRFPSYREEAKYLKKGYRYVIGCDEAGRGPLAGPVVAAACLLDPGTVGRRSRDAWHARIRDSKTVPEDERELLADEIMRRAAWGVGTVEARDIDRLNIHHASLEAMRRAALDLLAKLPAADNVLLILDGKFTVPGLPLDQRAVVNADADILSVAAASLIAKAHRDRAMRRLDRRFPGYGFARHKGYGTAEHRAALGKLGPLACHRKSFLKK